MIVEQLLCGELRNFTYIIGDEKSGLAAVIDPVDVEAILKITKKKGLKIKYIINTHSHFDHVAGNQELVSRTKAKVIAHKNSKVKRDIGVVDGDIIKVGNLKIRVISTPGHTQDSICLLADNRLFTGDTLFVGGFGRTDLPGGNYRQLLSSLKKLFKLDDKVIVYPGHDYGRTKTSTIGEERSCYYFTGHRMFRRTNVTKPSLPRQ